MVGPKNGPSLLLIPAQMGMWESYKKVLLPLSKIFQVYAIDVRGHGKSSWTPGHYSWKIIGEDIKIFIENVIKQKLLLAEIHQVALSLFGVPLIFLNIFPELFLRTHPFFLLKCHDLKNKINSYITG